MEVIQICGWHEFLITCIFSLMATQMFNLATDWLFSIPWWLTVPLTHSVIGCLFSIGGWQCLRPSQNFLPNFTLAGNQDTRIQFYFSIPDHVHAHKRTNHAQLSSWNFFCMHTPMLGASMCAYMHRLPLNSKYVGSLSKREMSCQISGGTFEWIKPLDWPKQIRQLLQGGWLVWIQLIA